MGVGTLQVIFWLSTSALVAFMVQLCWRRLRCVKAHTGTTAWQRMADKVIPCRVCKRPMVAQDIHVATDTCGAQGCVGVVMVGRARMAEARVATEMVLREQTVPALRKDGSAIYSAEGEPVMVPSSSGAYELAHVPGGALSEGDRAAMAWVRQHGGG